ncbi:MAG TPA: sugar-binding domain-containing protein [Candidatus Limnocylindrales bacterium]|nr:sugar-binding domain-containing protein [Candidatus Limnocylindrales bacterium]
MTQAARLYFDRQQSKVEIAAALGISRFRVARLIAQALDSGLVRIEYRDAPPSDRALARTIEERFGLDLCVVAGGGSDVGDVARLAASIVDDLVGPDDVVGIAWGSTLAAVVAAMPSRNDPSISVVQLAGSSIRSGRTQDPAELSRLLAERWGASHQPLFAPAFVDTPTLREALLRQTDLVATASMFERLTMAIVGVGTFGRASPEGSSLVRTGTLSHDVVTSLIGRGVVGDLLLYPVTADGAFPATDLAARAMCISVDGLRAVRRVVAVAAGAAKGPAIRGALQSGIVRILVTDAAAAEAIVTIEGAGANVRPKRARHRP